ncbi:MULTISPECIES: GNAT family N-acetyltransferase [unclassified Streptomyces]|uniref:GNAT family N-acetyltransferase n=1 Tax=unclassified Streptomyces TaxID=2593676 RepID=UPI002DD81104|nr:MULTISPECIES: GNAT family N-acetyltransferase [unclassified Streptomyces]WSA90277.1 GNAT family N-acetyltransferase [Streptomyces sp. NBC_01795]WSB74502.1 GNAT family N-acetyltransferase [Streptomyces sp. NBC_01775]WSS17113.1 GNAT family N-acetyltransferase [Streptomyces sp. NBC_01186]WSS45857.1 GNAT family N-acetyltransferase [Streptomyces sp. NBC_01187]
MRIRAGARHELGRLQDIERAAGRWFRDIGMTEIADDEPPSTAALSGYAESGGLWVVSGGEAARDAPEAPDAGGEEGAGDLPVAYALVEPLDGCLHIEQISVHPDNARRGIGRALIRHLARRAAADRVPALTLSTFTGVPWNAPYYERLGFRVLAVHELSPGLREIRRSEKEAGLDRWPRVCMRAETRALLPAGQHGRLRPGK